MGKSQDGERKNTFRRIYGEKKFIVSEDKKEMKKRWDNVDKFNWYINSENHLFWVCHKMDKGRTAKLCISKRNIRNEGKWRTTGTNEKILLALQ